MSRNCNLCDHAITDKCRKCGKFVYVLFCSIQDPQSDNEIHRVHKLGYTRCYNAQKENRIDSAIVSVSAPTEANWNLFFFFLGGAVLQPGSLFNLSTLNQNSASGTLAGQSFDWMSNGHK